MRGFSINLRDELKPYNIKVTTVFPGAAYTDSWAASGLERKRFMEASDIAKMVYTASQLSPDGLCGRDHSSSATGGYLKTKPFIIFIAAISGSFFIFNRMKQFHAGILSLFLLFHFFHATAQVNFKAIVPTTSHCSRRILPGSIHNRKR